MSEHGSAAVAHQFDDAVQQREAATLGMWVFLVTEIMMFGGLFATYVLYRSNDPAAFAAASHHLDTTLGAINTLVLLGSSLTMALAVRSAQLGSRGGSVFGMLCTMLLGAVFLGIKAYEYAHKFHEGLVPGPHFVFHGHESRSAELFFSLYFAMTGLHAIHMIIGMGVLGTLTTLAVRRTYSAAYHTPIEIGGLYWHFVDIVWIYLFPLLYLLGRH
jgi:cytochrome c oxidase subunit 3